MPLQWSASRLVYIIYMYTYHTHRRLCNASIIQISTVLAMWHWSCWRRDMYCSHRSQLLERGSISSYVMRSLPCTLEFVVDPDAVRPDMTRLPFFPARLAEICGGQGYCTVQYIRKVIIIGYYHLPVLSTSLIRGPCPLATARRARFPFRLAASINKTESVPTPHR